MAILIVSGEPGCRSEEVARDAARRLGFEVISQARLDGLLTDEFGPVELPDRAWLPAVTSVLARLARDSGLVVCFGAGEALFPEMSGVMRIAIEARRAYRAGTIMMTERLDRAAANAALRQRDLQQRQQRRRRSGKLQGAQFDVVLNAETFTPEQLSMLVAEAARTAALAEFGLLTAAAEAQIQFQARLQLARFNIVPAGTAGLKKKTFGHPSEELFANLLDFYRIAWEHEPRSFPLQWDKEGKVREAFTPDFYLPELDLYVELTTMKQALVTRKNRKIKLLRAIYPHINIQVFYQKDFQDLISKHDLQDRVVQR